MTWEIAKGTSQLSKDILKMILTNLDPHSKIKQVEILKLNSEYLFYICFTEEGFGERLVVDAEEKKMGIIMDHVSNRDNWLLKAKYYSVTFNYTDNPKLLTQVLEIIEKYSPLDLATVVDVRKFCNLPLLEPSLLLQLATSNIATEELVTLVNKTYPPEHYPDEYFQVAEFFEKNGKIQAAFDLYSLMKESNPHFIKACDKIYDVALEIQNHPETPEDMLLKIDKVLLNVLYKARTHDTFFQNTLDMRFHTTSGKIGLEATYKKVGSKEFVWQMIDVVKGTDNLEQQIKELKEKNELLKKELNTHKDKSPPIQRQSIAPK